ncbi:hypothetical protein GL213_06005 [Halogeometricum borinquense]|uniref:DUF8055 domain-containing protein n=1 Tax=Halogeometricum borinquense TaxID=60847 RepID=A0A482TG57_9EURY|nr:hypothetical protein [Halogeometricum borinquense]QIB74892.1 hypothetical protein G3I44_11730 [Halogeometricum borinquense]QIQ76108.1 hypothetical protein GL213_06005 [Halogeometricum borinquense]RYJ14238.1 hypothetical protein ELS19_09870 [Halogeometricum borinquense]
MTDDAAGESERSDEDSRHSAYYEQIRSLAADARAERRRFEAPSDATAEERALSYVREGVAPVTGIYVEGHTGGEHTRFSQTELDLLHRALNDWLSLYARCYGVAVDPDATVRTAAEILLQTHDARAVARLLTDAPPRR